MANVTFLLWGLVLGFVVEPLRRASPAFGRFLCFQPPKVVVPFVESSFGGCFAGKPKKMSASFSVSRRTPPPEGERWRGRPKLACTWTGPGSSKRSRTTSCPCRASAASLILRLGQNGSDHTPTKRTGRALPLFCLFVFLPGSVRCQARKDWTLLLKKSGPPASLGFGFSWYVSWLLGERGSEVYLSWYKGFGGLAGAILLSTRDVISSAARWRTQLGGNVFTLAPGWMDARAQFRLYKECFGWGSLLVEATLIWRPCADLCFLPTVSDYWQRNGVTSVRCKGDRS